MFALTGAFIFTFLKILCTFIISYGISVIYFYILLRLLLFLQRLIPRYLRFVLQLTSRIYMINLQGLVWWENIYVYIECNNSRHRVYHLYHFPKEDNPLYKEWIWKVGILFLKYYTSVTLRSMDVRVDHYLLEIIKQNHTKNTNRWKSMLYRHNQQFYYKINDKEKMYKKDSTLLKTADQKRRARASSSSWIQLLPLLTMARGGRGRDKIRIRGKWIIC